METFNQFNYNSGFNFDNILSVCMISLIIVLCCIVSVAYPKLGSTVLRCMLKEVSDFCDIERRRDWKNSTRQQASQLYAQN